MKGVPASRPSSWASVKGSVDMSQPRRAAGDRARHPWWMSPREAPAPEPHPAQLSSRRSKMLLCFRCPSAAQKCGRNPLLSHRRVPRRHPSCEMLLRNRASLGFGERSLLCPSSLQRPQRQGTRSGSWNPACFQSLWLLSNSKRCPSERQRPNVLWGTLLDGLNPKLSSIQIRPPRAGL